MRTLAGNGLNKTFRDQPQLGKPFSKLKTYATGIQAISVFACKVTYGENVLFKGLYLAYRKQPIKGPVFGENVI